jgi:hypothetical protein
MVIAEGMAAHGGRLAAEPAGHDVMASLKHGSSLSVRDEYSPLSPATPRVFSRIPSMHWSYGPGSGLMSFASGG